MKRAPVLIFIFTILLFQSNTGQNYSFLGLCVGGAIPQGSYANTNFSDSINGFAKNGFVFSFDAAWFPDDYMGIGATVTFASNNTDKQNYMDTLRNYIIDSYSQPFSFPPDSIVLDYGVWKYLNLYIGPNFTYPIGRFNIDLRAMGGLSLVWRPTQDIEINYPESGLFSKTIEDKPVPSLGYSIGGGIRYAFKKGYVIRVIAEYANTKPTFTFIDQISWNSEEELFTTKENDIAVPIKNLHLGIGIAYNFEL
jgi:hypothetical protein